MTYIPTTGTVTSGTYTPTLTNTTNIAASSPYSCQYVRIGSVVTVSGKADIDPVVVGSTVLGISLPIASAIANDNEVSGVGSSADSQAGSISGDITNDRATFSWTTTNAANVGYFFTFTYRII